MWGEIETGNQNSKIRDKTLVPIDGRDLDEHMTYLLTFKEILTFMTIPEQIVGVLGFIATSLLTAFLIVANFNIDNNEAVDPNNITDLTPTNFEWTTPFWAFCFLITFVMTMHSGSGFLMNKILKEDINHKNSLTNLAIWTIGNIFVLVSVSMVSVVLEITGYLHFDWKFIVLLIFAMVHRVGFIIQLLHYTGEMRKLTVSVNSHSWCFEFITTVEAKFNISEMTDVTKGSISSEVTAYMSYFSKTIYFCVFIDVVCAFLGIIWMTLLITYLVVHKFYYDKPEYANFNESLGIMDLSPKILDGSTTLIWVYLFMIAVAMIMCLGSGLLLRDALQIASSSRKKTLKAMKLSIRLNVSLIIFVCVLWVWGCVLFNSKHIVVFLGIILFRLCLISQVLFYIDELTNVFVNSNTCHLSA